MHRIESAGSVEGRFSEGNPATGQQATVISAAWLNTLQEEVAQVIEAAGITLKTAATETENQLLAAIQALITGGGAGQATVTSAGVVELATALETIDGLDDQRAVTSAGLSARTATQSRTGLIQLGTTEQVKALVSAVVAVTPARLGEIFDMRTWGANDYVRIPDVPGGIIIQMGVVNSSAGTTAVVFPTTFPTALRAIVLGDEAEGTSGHDVTAGLYQDKTTSGFTLSSQSGTETMWIAIGY